MVAEVSADTGDLAEFVDRGTAFVAGLRELEASLTAVRARVADLAGPVAGPGGRERLTALIAGAERTNGFVHGVLGDLLAGLGVGGPLRAAVLGGLIEPPTDETRDAVVAAMRQGLAPDDSGVDEAYFPPDYLRVVSLDALIVDLETQRDRADGHGWNPFDGDDAARAAIDERLASTRELRATFADRIGASATGRLTEVEAVAATGGWTGGPQWTGDRLGRWMLDYRDGTSEITPSGRLALRDDGGAATRDEFAFVAARVADHDAVALGFYNRLGVEGTAHLPTLVADNFQGGGDAEARALAFERFGIGLGAASRSIGPQGERGLAFDAGQLIGRPPPITDDNVYWHHPALLFATGDFDDAFLAEAVVAGLSQAEAEVAGIGRTDRMLDALDGNPTPVHGTATVVGNHLAWYSLGQRTAVVSGQDPRNILLGRAAEDTGAAALAVAGLAERYPELDPLLFAEVPFEVSGRERSERYFVAPLDEGSPVTAFLATAGLDDETARTILRAAAGSELGFSDVGVAAGVDGVLATHATILYPADVLAAAGIQPTTLNVTPGRSGDPIEVVDAPQWKAAHGKVLDRGRGEQLAVRTERLVDDALRASVDPVTLDVTSVEPLAVVAGHVVAETREAQVAYAAGLDEQARHRNRVVNTTVSGMLGVAGLAGPGVGIAATAASAGWTYAYEGESTDNERETLRAQLESALLVGDPSVWFGRLAGQVYPSRSEAEAKAVEWMTGDAPAPVAAAASELAWAYHSGVIGAFDDPGAARAGVESAIGSGLTEVGGGAQNPGDGPGDHRGAGPVREWAVVRVDVAEGAVDALALRDWVADG